MFEIYEVNGQRYEVSPDQLEKFFKDFPNATKVGKTSDSAIADPTAESSDTGSILENGSLVLPKAVDSKELVRNLSSIDDAVSYDNDPVLKQNVLNAFFDLSGSEVDPSKVEGAEMIHGPTGTGVDWSTVKFDDYAQHAADSAEKHFGKDKYNLYKKYKETGELKIEDIPNNLIDGFNKVRQQEKSKREQLLKEDYIRDNWHIKDIDSYHEAISIDSDVRGLYSTDFIEKYSEQEKLSEDVGTYTDEEGWHHKRDVFQKQKAKTEISKKAVDMQNNYLKNLSEILEEDYANHEKYLETFNIKTSEELSEFINNPEIDINTRKDVLAKNRVIAKRLEDYKKMAIKFNDKVSALKGLDKSYDWGYRAGLALENAVFGDIGLAIKGVGALTAEAMDPTDDSVITNYLRDSYKSHIDYSESLKQKREANLPVNIKFKDLEWDNAGTFVGQQLGDNIFSIGAGLGLGGVVSTGSKVGIRAAKNIITGAFVGVEGGAKLSEMEIAQKNAVENLDFINKELNNENITPDARLKLEEQKEYNEKALNYTQAERAFSAITYGGIAALAERMGTMRYVEDLYQIGRITGPMTFKNSLRGAGNFILRVPVTEQLEETATQIGHNLMDQLILKEDKSLIEGIDADFFASTFITSMAIGGPGVAKGVRNAFRGHVQTKEEIQKFRDLGKEFIDNQYILNKGTNLSKGGINKKQADFIKARQKEILEEVGTLDIQAFNKIADLDAGEITNLFEIGRKQRNLWERNQQLGAIGPENKSVNKERKKLNKEYNDLQSEKEAILESPARKREDKLKETAKEQGLDESVAMKNNFNYGRHAYYNNLMRGLGNKVKEFDGEDALIDLSNYLDSKIKSGVIKQRQKAEIIKEYNQGSNGTYVGNDLLTFENNVRKNIVSPFSTDIEKADAIQVAVHEYQHRYDQKKGLVKDGKVIASHKPLVTALKEHVNQLHKRGDIDKKTYNEFKQRVDQYSDKVNKNKVVDQTELLTLLGTMKRAGMLKEEKSSPLYAAKSFINKVRSAIPGLKDNYTLLDMKTTGDVLRYIDSFNKSLTRGKAQLPVEQKQKGVDQSKGIYQDVETMYSDEAWADPTSKKNTSLMMGYELVPEAIRRMRNVKLDDSTKEDIALDFATSERGLFGLIKGFDKSKNESVMGYLNSFVPGTKRSLFDARLQEFYEKDPRYSEIVQSMEQEGVAAKVEKTVESEDVKAEVKPRKKKTVLAERFGITKDVDKAISKIVPNLDLDKLNFKTLKNKIPEIIEDLFGIASKKLETGANITKKELQSAQMFINKNADLLIAMLPEGATPSGTATGVPRVLLNEFYTKGERAKMAKTGTKAGLAVQTKNPNIDKKKFLETFGIIDGKPIRTDRNTSARVLALANLTGKMITNQAVRTELAKLKANDKVINKIAEGKSTVMFSKGAKTFNINGTINDILKAHVDIVGKDRVYSLNTKEDVDLYVAALISDVLPLMPRDFWFGTPDKKGNFGTEFTPSNRVVSKKNRKEVYKYYQEEIKALRDLPDTAFGKDVVDSKGNTLDFSKSSYSSIFKNEETIKANEENGKIKEFNNKVGTIHKELWSRIYQAVQDSPSKAAAIANYLKLTANDSSHWHKLGAQFDGYSINPKGIWKEYTDKKTGKKTKKWTAYEYEHAMPATAAYMYLMDNALKGYDFESTYKPVIDNYKLIALDSAENAKLNKANLGKKMPKDWNTIDNTWWERYFNEIVGGIDGGIDPNNILGLDGKTFAERFNINAEGNPAGVVTGIKKDKTLNDATIEGRKTIKESKGITVLDFDDTLATTKSGVRATIPNLDGTPKPSRKAILLAGGAGSGKSNVIKQLGLVKDGFKVVNQDIALEWLKKNAGIPTDMRDLTREQLSTLGKLSWEARKIAKRKYGKFKGQGDGVVIDGTGGSVKTIQTQKAELEAAGYDVQMLFVETSLDVALERNKLRKERSLRDSIVKRNHEAVQKNKSEFKEIFGRGFTEINTDNLKQNDPIPVNVSNKINEFVTGYEKRRLDAEEFAREGADLLAQGAKFDFSEFNVVMEGQTAPLFNKAMKLQDKFGSKDMFVLTARPAESAPHIHEFLKANGLNIPLKNITGLANSTAEAKALWMADKVAEGYNDFYFADDALQNVQAVQNMLDQFDVKSKVQQAKINFSKGAKVQFNDIMQDVTGIDSNKRFSLAKARKRGEKKGRFRPFIPPSHEDFIGLLYNFIGKGEKGNQHRDFFEKNLIKPLNRAYNELNAAKQVISNDYKNLIKKFPDTRKKLTKKTPDGDYTYGDALRVYLWDKAGFEIPGMSKTDVKELTDLVKSDPSLQSFADAVGLISRQKEGYTKPKEEWEVGDIRTDLADATMDTGRQKFFGEFIENADIIFDKENLNKIEAAFGRDFREALEDMLYRIKNGRKRPTGNNKLVNRFTEWINGAVGSTMFINTRSAVLQQLSMVNFLNFEDNNIFTAAKAFANQKQFWKDYAKIFNSDFLKQRRSGIAFDVNGAELAQAVSKSKEPFRAAIRHLLQKGFILTQLGDSNAIAMGGATFYRNRVNKYLKDGLSQKEAETRAWDDFVAIAETTQQSARADMTSGQQNSPLGKFILAFQNVTSQYNRIMKKAGLDLINRRKSPPYTSQVKSDMANISKIIYYGAIQNAIFYGLQTALFAMMFSDDEKDEEFFKKKRDRVINGSIDSILRGMGVGGAIISTIKNTAMKFAAEQNKDWNSSTSILMNELLQLSPPLGIKARKLTSAEKTLKYNKKTIKEMDIFDINNPIWEATTNIVEGTTNLPANRMHRLTTNTQEALNAENEWWQRLALGLGWSTWDLDINTKEKLKKKKKKRKIRLN